MMLAANIQATMERQGLSPAELARRAKINATGVYDILSGKSRSPRLDTVHKIAAALRVPISVLLEEKKAEELRQEILDAVDKLPEREQLRALRTIRMWAEEG